MRGLNKYGIEGNIMGRKQRTDKNEGKASNEKKK